MTIGFRQAQPIALAAFLGLFLGTLLGVLIQRLPREDHLRLFRRPRCTRCGQPLGWELVPLLGYLLQRGRCRHCGKPIPVFFPLVELLTGTVFALLVWRHGPSGTAGLYAVFSLALILTLFLDWLHRDIYYLIIIPPAALALLSPLWGNNLRAELQSRLAGLGVGLIFFGLLFLLGQVLFRSQALGLGDVWLAGSIGAMAGFYGALWALSLGIVLAAVAAGLLLLLRRHSAGDYMPYGAYLCLAALGYFCFGPI
ncbi:MAG: prepilin peptidase [Chloroflexia bacterium]